MANRVTLQTIADALGVSRTTVSNAYNRPDQLAPDLRERILATARQLGYSGPDPAARRLRSGRRDVVGVLLTDQLSFAFTDPAAVILLQGIARATEAAGMAVLLIPEHGPGVRNAVQDAVVDAFCIYAMPIGHPNVQAALERRLPTVVVDAPRLPDQPFVGIDDRRGAYLAAEHLTALGHRRFGILMERSRASRESDWMGGSYGKRLTGYREALEAVGVDWDAVPKVSTMMDDPDRGIEGGRELLRNDPRPTAILAATDLLAIGTVEAARQDGVEVPRHLSVVGFDDVPAAAWSGITTVRQPLLEKGETAGRLLLAEHPEPEVILPLELVVRRSTAAPPAG